MENVHPLVIGIHSAENYEKLKKIINGISFIADWSIDQIIAYEMTSRETRVKEKNVKELLELLPTIIIPKGTLIFHSNKFTCDSLVQASDQLNTSRGLYEPVQDRHDLSKICSTCRISRNTAPSEYAGNKPRINELAYNPNVWDPQKNECRCAYGKQHRMYANFNFSGNYVLDLTNPMRGTQIYIVAEDMLLLDTAYASVELGYALKNNSDIGIVSVFREYFIEKGLDGMTMFDTSDPQVITDLESEGIKKGVLNSCYKYGDKFLCPELVLLHNNEDDKWQRYQSSHENATTIGTRKLNIMGMVDLVDHQDNKLSRNTVSQMIDLVFSKYTNYIQVFNQQNQGLYQVQSFEIKYTDNNIYKKLVFNDDTPYDQEMLFRYLQQCWPLMNNSRDVFIKANDPLIGIQSSIGFFNMDTILSEDIHTTVKPWIEIHSNIKIMNFVTRNFTFYSTQGIWNRIFSVYQVDSDTKDKLYLISCFKIIPGINDAYAFDIIDFLYTHKDRRRLDSIYNTLKTIILESYITYINKRHTAICSKFNISNAFSDFPTYQIIKDYITTNTSIEIGYEKIKEFIYEKNPFIFVSDHSIDILSELLWKAKPNFEFEYHIKIKTDIASHSSKIREIINTHFKTNIITQEIMPHILSEYEKRYNLNQHHSIKIVYDLYKIKNDELFVKKIDQYVINLVKFFWDIFADYIVSQGGNKETMNQLFIDQQSNIMVQSSAAYSPLYDDSSDENIVYLYLENEIPFDNNELWEYYRNNHDSDILHII